MIAGRVAKAASYVAVIAIAVWTLAPFAILVATSFLPSGVTLGARGPLTTSNYATVLTDATQSWVASLQWSMELATIVTILTLALAVPSAYGLSRWTSRASRTIAGWIFGTRFLPPIVAAVPLFILFDRAHLLGGAAALVLADLLITLPFAVWVLKTFIDDIPRTLDELATLDGFRFNSRIRHVLLPNLWGPLAAIGAMSWLLVWNEYLFALLFGGDTRPLTVTIASWNTYVGVQWAVACAAGVLACIPACLLLGACLHFASRLFGFGLRLGR